MAAIVSCNKPVLQDLINQIIGGWGASRLLSTGRVAYQIHLEGLCAVSIKLHGSLLVRVEIQDSADCFTIETHPYPLSLFNWLTALPI